MVRDANQTNVPKQNQDRKESVCAPLQNESPTVITKRRTEHRLTAVKIF